MESSIVRRQRHVSSAELDRLELTIRRLLEAHDALRQRADTAEQRVAELEGAVRDLAGGGIDPVALAGEVRRLEQQNGELKDRIARAGEVVQRITARLHFAEEER